MIYRSYISILHELYIPKSFILTWAFWTTGTYSVDLKGGENGNVKVAFAVRAMAQVGLSWVAVNRTRLYTPSAYWLLVDLFIFAKL